MKPLSLLLPVLLLAAAGSASCLEPTQIELTLRTDVAWSTDRTVAITVAKDAVTDATEPTTTAETAWSDDGHIGTLVILPGSDRDERVSVRAVLGLGRDPSTCTAEDAAGCIIARRKLAFVPHEPLALPITLYSACEGVPCDENTTCSALGTCVSADVDPELCADGRVCEPQPGESVSTGDAAPATDVPDSFAPDGLPPVADADASSSADADSAPPARRCPTTDVTVPSSGFFSWGSVVNSATIEGGDPLTITIASALESATFTRTLETPDTACPLHFVMDVARLQIAAAGTSVMLMTVFRDGAPELVLAANYERGEDRYELSLRQDDEVEVDWDFDARGTIELIVPLRPADGAPRLIVRGTEYTFAAVGRPPREITATRLQFGLQGANGAVSYRSARYFFAP